MLPLEQAAFEKTSVSQDESTQSNRHRKFSPCQQVCFEEPRLHDA